MNVYMQKKGKQKWIRTQEKKKKIHLTLSDRRTLEKAKRYDEKP